ncbi:RING zinc finger-containing protein [Cavenderia fasciculata]|uniref:RING zinc finger-containing protein n=1 Tax=Cavenderia fasciculata TaxID=261658 RepID=F4PGV9_CACFS|nr:RING zinc finger-containing protein [Cavenderia fasciculata]EGG24943.1 RING zinc finger-containing protein [Cavenderia fasciculata]|eukprot:XP_004362794.1 RING zinc finger-containing protein [Cavenderia fasciculata]
MSNNIQKKQYSNSNNNNSSNNEYDNVEDINNSNSKGGGGGKGRGEWRSGNVNNSSSNNNNNNSRNNTTGSNSNNNSMSELPQLVTMLSAPAPPTLRVYDPQQQFSQSQYNHTITAQMMAKEKDGGSSESNNNSFSQVLASATSQQSDSTSNSLNNSINDSIFNKSTTDIVDQEMLKKILSEDDDDDVDIDDEQEIDINQLLNDNQDIEDEEDLEEMMSVANSSKIIDGSSSTGGVAVGGVGGIGMFSPIYGTSPSTVSLSSAAGLQINPHHHGSNLFNSSINNHNNSSSTSSVISKHMMNSIDINSDNILPMLWGSKNARRSLNGIVVEPQFYTKLSEQLSSPDIRKEAGYPTCFSTSKYICIGTSHGFLLIFNYNQDLVSIIGGTICADSGSVTAIDQPSCKVNEDWMVSGHQNGQIILWDIPTGKPLKVMDATIHKHPILHLKFFSDGQRFISSDAHGVTYIITITRGFMSLGSDQQLLLNGNLGPVLSIAPLLPGNYPHPTDKSHIFALATKRKILVISASIEGVCILNNKITKPTYDELRVFDPFALEEVESVNVKSMQIIHHSKFQSVYSFHNSIRTNKSRIYLLGLNGFFTAHVLTWLERLSVLVSNQQWFEALCLALDFYEGKAKATTGLSSNTIDCKLLTGEKIIEMLSQLCYIVFSQPNGGGGGSLNNSHSNLHSLGGKSGGGSDSPSIVILRSRNLIPKNLIDNEQISNMTMHQQLALICIEFCVTIKRTDFLFGEIFNYFVESGMVATILEFLEPYILHDRLVHLNPEVMQFMMNHYQEKGILLRAEQCLLHLDIASLDFHQTVVLCRKHHLYSALIYLYNRGLDDYITPLEDMMELVVLKPTEENQQEEEDNGNGHINRGDLNGGISPNLISSNHLNLVEEVSKRLLHYLRYSLSGRVFPSGKPIPSQRVPSLKMEIYEYLFLRNIFPEDPTPYPRLFNLLKLNSLEMINILSNSFDDQLLSIPASPKQPQPSQQYQQQLQQQQLQQQQQVHKAGSVPSVNSSLVIPAIPFNVNKSNLNHHTMMSVLLLIVIDRSQQPYDPHTNESWPFTIEQQGQVCVLLAKCFEKRLIKSIEPTLLGRLVGILSVPPIASAAPIYNRTDRQSSLLGVLMNSSPKDYDSDKLLVIAEGNELYRVAQYIYSQQRQYAKMVVCQIRDPDTRAQTFDYVRQLLENPALNDADRQTVRQTTISNLAHLIVVDSTATAQLIMDYFASDHEKIVKELGQFPKLQYTYLVGLLGNDSSSRVAIQQRTGIYISNETYELYIKLMCMYSSDLVYKYLVSHDDYPLDACLKICQQYNNFEGATYLLERTGDVYKALEMIVTVLKKKIEDILKHFSNVYANVKNLKNEKATAIPIEKEIMDTLNTAIALCQRNSQKLQISENQMIWFRLLDTIVLFVRKVKQSMINSNSNSPLLLADDRTPGGWSKGSLISSPQQSQSPSLVPLTLDPNGNIDTSSSSSSSLINNINLLQQKPKSAIYVKCTGFLNRLIHIILNSMMGSVALPLILTKIVNDHGSDEFGDFKAIITGMLDTCTFETSILHTANQLIQNDMYNTTRSYIRQRSKAYSPVMRKCVMCSRPIGDFPASSNNQQVPLDLVVVFQCNHAIHSTCMGKHSACPLCSKDNENAENNGSNNKKKKEKSNNNNNINSSSNPNQQKQPNQPLSPILFDPKKIRQDKDGGQGNTYLERLSNYTKLNKRNTYSYYNTNNILKSKSSDDHQLYSPIISKQASRYSQHYQQQQQQQYQQHQQQQQQYQQQHSTQQRTNRPTTSNTSSQSKYTRE